MTNMIKSSKILFAAAMIYFVFAVIMNLFAFVVLVGEAWKDIFLFSSVPRNAIYLTKTRFVQLIIFNILTLCAATTCLHVISRKIVVYILIILCAINLLILISPVVGIIANP